MDERKLPVPPNELNLQPASGRIKARVFQYLPLCVFLLRACGPTASRSPTDAITFDTLKGLDDFEFATAGDGKPGEWSIIENNAGRVLAQIDGEPADNRFPLAIYRPFSGRDVYVSIRFMTVSGETDQAAGVFVRFASVDDYYVARASALASLIVCTCNRAASLDRFLSCVVGLNLPAASDWEFLVVNNGSTDQTESVIAKYKAVLPIRSVFEPKAGLSNARNRGTDEARGDYIIWTDDDVVPHDDFICAYLRAFKANPNAVVFGGKILPVLEAPVSEPFRKNLCNLRYLVAHRDFGDEPMPLSVAEDHIPYGANFALRTKEQREHRYDPNLGVATGRRLGGEEVAVIKDLLDHGYSGVWVPESKVDHMISTSRQHEDYVSEFYLALGDTIETMRFQSPSRKPPEGSRPPLNIAVKKRISHLLYVLLRKGGFPSYLRFLASYSYNSGALQCWERAAAQRKLD